MQGMPGAEIGTGAERQSARGGFINISRWVSSSQNAPGGEIPIRGTRRPVFPESSTIVSAMTEKICIVCGKKYEARRVMQKYCSVACRRYANRRDGIVAREWEEGGEELRRFQCVRCGEVVRVTSPRDCRTKFCSRHCERLYWKHSHGVEAKLVCREFDCKECGKHVVIEDPHDSRRLFCSNACGLKWVAKQRSAKLKEAAKAKDE